MRRRNEKRFTFVIKEAWDTVLYLNSRQFMREVVATVVVVVRRAVPAGEVEGDGEGRRLRLSPFRRGVEEKESERKEEREAVGLMAGAGGRGRCGGQWGRRRGGGRRGGRRGRGR